MRITALLLLYAGTASFGTYQTFRPMFDSGFARIQTERGDGMLNHLILENSWLAVSDPNYRGTLTTAPFCFPQRGTIYYSENLFGAAPVYWALRPLLPYDLAYAWWQIVFNVFNFVAFAVVARWFRFPHLLALCGAFLWAFALVHADQVKHQQMIGRMWMPFALYYAVMLAAEPSTRALNRLLCCVFLQSLTCFYSGWFLVMGLALFFPALVALRPGAAGELKRFLLARPGTVLGIVGVWGLVMAALFVPYILATPGVAREYKDCYEFLPTPAAWITGPNGSRWEQTLAPYCQPVLYECKLFSGFTLYAMMLAAAIHLPFLRHEQWPVLRSAAMAGLITAAVWWLLTVSTAPDGESLWRWVRYLPGGRSIRCVVRVYLVVYLFGSFAALAWLHMVAERIRPARLRAGVLVAIVGAVVWEQTGVLQASFERRNFYPLVDRAAEDMRGAEAGYVVPVFTDQNGLKSVGPYGVVFAMWVGVRANVPVVNGYSGVLPPRFLGLGPMNDDQIREWLLRYGYSGRVRVVDPDRPGVYREFVVE